MLKGILRKTFKNFFWFYSFLGYKVFIGIIFSFFVGLLDGFGLTVFLPLLEIIGSNSPNSIEGAGKFKIIVQLLNDKGVILSLELILFTMVFFFLSKGVMRYFSLVYRIKLQQELIRSVRLKTLRLLNSVNFKYFISSDTGRIQNIMTGEVDRIQGSYLSYFTAVEQLILVFVYMGFALFVDYQFALLVGFGGFIVSFIYKKIYKHTTGASKKFTDNSNVYQGSVIQHISNFKYLRSTAMTKSYSNRLENIILQIEDSRKRIGMLSSYLESSREPLLIIVVTLVILVQVNIFEGNLGSILISLLFFYRGLTALTGMQNSWNKFLGVSGSLLNLSDFQNTLIVNQESKGSIPFSALNENIQLENISYSYGSTEILKNISLVIPKNETVAIVGESGSGKTTLINLISGLIPVSKGEILIDGVALNQLIISEYQKRLGYITQESVIFNDTIFNNVTFWENKTPETEDRFYEALKKASIHEFVKDLPLGLDTELGNNGINLSGGQKQRISIARELYKCTDILLLDEATSSLDSETEKIIQKNLDNLRGKNTIVIIAHRLSTIKNADRIILMNNGQVEKIGSYDQLFVNTPRFRKMVEMQEL